MATPLIELLTDTAVRHRIEDPSRGAFDHYRWAHRVKELEHLYGTLLREDAAMSPSR
jgi:hypothetical protein